MCATGCDKAGAECGEIVRLGDLGSLQVGLRSKGAKTEKEFTLANITKARFKFRPGKDMVDLLSNLNYVRVPVIERKKKQDVVETQEVAHEESGE